MPQSRSDITQLIHDWRHGGQTDLARLYELVYSELKVIAAREKRRFWSADTIGTTALVNEAYLKLAEQQGMKLENRAHFFAVAATAMRHILVNYVEQRNALKRGGDWLQVTMSAVAGQTPEQPSFEQILAVDQAIEHLSEIDQTLAVLVEMRFFAGMTEAEIARVQSCSERTVRRNWKMAKALLQNFFEH